MSSFEKSYWPELASIEQANLLRNALFLIVLWRNFTPGTCLTNRLNFVVPIFPPHHVLNDNLNLLHDTNI